MSTQDTTTPIEPAKATASVKAPAPKRRRKRSRRSSPIPKSAATQLAELSPVNPQDMIGQLGFKDDQAGIPKPKSLAPDFKRHTEAIFLGHWYWLGILLSLKGIEGVAIGGVYFAKRLALVTRSSTGKTIRTEIYGDTLELTKPRIELITKKIGNTIVRWREYGDPVTPGVITVANVGTPGPTGRKGQLITIPDDEDVAVLKEQGRVPRKPYKRQPEDDGIYKYLYCVPCDGPNARGLELPPPLSETGLKWED